MNKLTEKEYWDKTYENDSKLSFLPTYNSLDTQIDLELIEIISSYIKGDNVLEIGAGDSNYLIYLSNRFKKKSFSGMDYSKTGCENLIKRAKNLKLKIEVINQDLFIPNSKYFNGFSLVYSIGLVEHFDDLKYILSFTKKYINTGGYHIALIPNLSGIYGWMAKYIDNEVYKIHNPHNLKSFIEGHEEANLEVIYASYQGYFNVGVLSSLKPFKENWFFHKIFYKCLRLVTKILSFINKKLFKIPKSQFFSPYIIAVSKVKEDD